MLTACFGVLVFGVLIYRNPVLFWDQFNPYLKPYSRFTIAIGKLIGSLWAAGATLGCIALAGNAIRESLHHHWLR
jgi:hypothetical protein